MRTIWKFPLGVVDEQTIEMPFGAAILCVQVQGTKGDAVACIWALVDTNRPKVTRHVHVVGTGHGFAPTRPSLYVGTFQIADGALVFHVFINDVAS